VPTVFEQALEAVGRGGTILFFAPTEPGVKVAIPVNEFWRNNIKIIHSYGSSPDDTKEAIELMRRKRPALEKMITHKLGLEDIGKGFRLMSEGKDSLKIIIQPHQP